MEGARFMAVVWVTTHHFREASDFATSSSLVGEVLGQTWALPVLFVAFGMQYNGKRGATMQRLVSLLALIVFVNFAAVCVASGCRQAIFSISGLGPMPAPQPQPENSTRPSCSGEVAYTDEDGDNLRFVLGYPADDLFRTNPLLVKYVNGAKKVGDGTGTADGVVTRLTKDADGRLLDQRRWGGVLPPGHLPELRRLAEAANVTHTIEVPAAVCGLASMIGQGWFVVCCMIYVATDCVVGAVPVRFQPCVVACGVALVLGPINGLGAALTHSAAAALSCMKTSSALVGCAAASVSALLAASVDPSALQVKVYYVAVLIGWGRQTQGWTAPKMVEARQLELHACCWAALNMLHIVTTVPYYTFIVWSEALVSRLVTMVAMWTFVYTMVLTCPPTKERSRTPLSRALSKATLVLYALHTGMMVAFGPRAGLLATVLLAAAASALACFKAAVPKSTTLSIV